MDIFGLAPFVAAIVFACIGIGATNTVAWLKSEKAFNPRNVAASAIIGFPTAVIIIGTELQVLARVELTELEIGLTIIGLIAQVAGFDILAKNGAKVIKK